MNASDSASLIEGGAAAALLKLCSAVEILINREACKSTMVDICNNRVGKKLANPPPGPTGQLDSCKTCRGGPAQEPWRLSYHKGKKVLRETERRIILFNLDLSTATTLNKETILRKVIVALYNFAVKGNHDWVGS